MPPAGAGSQVTGLNNSAGNRTLNFQVSGVTSGNEVEILADGNPVGKAAKLHSDVVAPRTTAWTPSP